MGVSIKLVAATFLSATATIVAADYDSFYFSSNALSFLCGDTGYECAPPFACSHDATVDKFYCCIPGPDNVCFTGSTDCNGDDDQTAGTNQIDCGSFCCLSGREQCTQREGQINICWAAAANPFTNVTSTRMNDTFSSLSSAEPSATSFTFELAQVTSTIATNTAAFDAMSSISVITSSTATSTANANSSSDADSGISGGAIAGIVVGVVLGLALFAGLAFLLMRARRNKSVTPSQEPYRQTDASGAYTAAAANDKARYANGIPEMQSYSEPAPVEMDTGSPARPMQEWYAHAAAEMESNPSGTYTSQYSTELPANR